MKLSSAVQVLASTSVMANKHMVSVAVSQHSLRLCKQEIAELARKHNDANVICIPARFVRDGDAEKMLNIFMNTAFEGGRHQGRVSKISC